ncbi:MAG: DUF4178 domain-containing protein [Cyanobacteria bacterium P01_D01_bin.56]
MFIVYCALIVLVLGIGIFLFMRQQSAPVSTAAAPPMQRTLFDLQLGDIVQHQGIDWVVEGQMIYEQDGFTWQEYLLQDGGKRVWLSVEEDDWLEVALMEPTKALTISTPEPPKEIEFQGETYHCTESGTAQMTRIRASQRPTVEQCRFFDYEGPGEKLLSIENWSGDFEVTVGRAIQPQTITILPGDGESVHSANM